MKPLQNDRWSTNLDWRNTTTARGLVMNIKEEKYFIYFKLKKIHVEGETHGLIAAPFDAPADPQALIMGLPL
jgi:hypothetical protein